jgi:hypothetical protein
MTRCTCLYRPAPPGRRPEHEPVLELLVRDPGCPAAELHIRSDARADASAALRP